MRYPFTPELLDALPEEMAELYRSLEATLLDEICSRLKLAGELNEVTVQDIRALRSHGISLEEIEKAIQRTANISQRDLKKLLDDVVERNQRYYREVIDLADLRAVLTAGDGGRVTDLHLGHFGEGLRRQGGGEQRRGYQQAGGASQNGVFHEGVPPSHFVIFCSSRSRVRRARRRNSQGSSSRGR